jgi:hypothetical protein
MNFCVGQRVVCIARNGWYREDNGEPTPGGPTQNDICTVIGVDTEEVVPALCLEEYGGRENLWDARYFRPAVEPDISVFTAMLTKGPYTNRKLARIPRKRVKEDA